MDAIEDMDMCNTDKHSIIAASIAAVYAPISPEAHSMAKASGRAMRTCTERRAALKGGCPSCVSLSSRCTSGVQKWKFDIFLGLELAEQRPDSSDWAS